MATVAKESEVYDDHRRNSCRRIEECGVQRESAGESIKYMKSVVAFANGTGGKIIFGIADKTREVVGFDKEDVFKKMDAIANAVSDSCEPAIIPDITLQTVDGKTVIVAEFLKADSGHITLKRLDEREAYMSVLLEQPGLLTSI